MFLNYNKKIINASIEKKTNIYQSWFVRTYGQVHLDYGL